jgi:hypothetical protein
MSEENNFEKRFKSVNLAYEIAVDSYDVLAKRLDSIDGRLQTMLALFASATVAVLAIAANRNLHFHSRWFYAAIGAMALAVTVTIIARLYGTIDVLDPSKLNTDKWLQCTEWEFKNLVIQAGALAFANNKRLIDVKWALALIVIATFSLGALCLTMWVIRMTTNA